MVTRAPGSTLQRSRLQASVRHRGGKFFVLSGILLQMRNSVVHREWEDVTVFCILQHVSVWGFLFIKIGHANTPVEGHLNTVAVRGRCLTGWEVGRLTWVSGQRGLSQAKWVTLKKQCGPFVLLASFWHSSYIHFKRRLLWLGNSWQPLLFGIPTIYYPLCIHYYFTVPLFVICY